ncbi:hypothetical protein [Portibacter lacus]|uniref:hypothetical protein n=1 Tax=Portibacter lacus TaxID=1099794 RepID=UPI001F292E07|nr:hypothetical protein [Portibacter lacus]
MSSRKAITSKEAITNGNHLMVSHPAEAINVVSSRKYSLWQSMIENAEPVN